MHSLMRCSAIVLLVVCVSNLAAAPFVPQSSADVLERLPLRAGDQTAQQLREMRLQAARNPKSLDLAAKLARGYIEVGRTQSDPRYYGYAQAALSQWWSMPKPPLQVRLLRATLRQSTHQFDAAMEDLNEVLKLVPEHPQALLTRATVQQVRGNFAEARRDCEALSELVDALVSAACKTGVESSTGGLRSAYAALNRTYASEAQPDPVVASWVAAQLADMAERLGDKAAAQTHFRAALQGDAEDATLLAAYADFLLDEKRPREVLDLLKDRTRADGLLLRYTLAQKELGLRQAEGNIASLAARFDAARRRGERVHLREEARFTLELLHRPVEALQLAQENWKAQKEPADARVYLEAARAAKKPAAAQEVSAWVSLNKLEDRRLVPLLEKAG